LSPRFSDTFAGRSNPGFHGYPKLTPVPIDASDDADDDEGSILQN
jgi:hypothetical protein